MHPKWTTAVQGFKLAEEDVFNQHIIEVGSAHCFAVNKGGDLMVSAMTMTAKNP